MVLNELCTNTTKYGALSNTDGRVEIAAAVDAAKQQFRLTWTERGGQGSRADPPQMRLIEHSFMSQLQGKSEVVFEPAGVVCTLDIPLAVLKVPSTA
jgi:two-component sensor histidine kinase